MQTLFERKIDLSVIIPVYNLERFLEPMLTSLKSQVHEYNVEHIFVLNNCTDRSEDVIRESGIDCKILYEPQQGCGCARNKGMEEAQGEYIWFMDGDDWLLFADAIQSALSKAYAEDLDILWIPYTSEKFTRLYFSMVWQYLMRKSFIDEFRFPSYQPCEDDAFMLKVLEKAGKGPINFHMLPHLAVPKYYYNYMREGSNMFRHFHGEKI